MFTRDKSSYREQKLLIRSRGPTLQATAFQRQSALPGSPPWPPHVVDHDGGLAAIGEAPATAGDSPHPSAFEIPRDVAPGARIAPPASEPTLQARRHMSGADRRARPGRACAVWPAPPRRRFVAGQPGWADGAGPGGEGTRGRTPRRCARGEPSASAGRVTLRSGSITVPISVVFVNLVLPKRGRPRRGRSVVHAAAAAPATGGRPMQSLPFITWRPCYRRAGMLGIREPRGWL